MTSSDQLSAKSFTEEESLWAIYKKARRIPSSRFNVITTLGVLFFSSFSYFFSEIDAEATVKSAREMAAFGFNSTLTLLGFLVAGFTIFATITNPNMLIAMGLIKNPQSDLSWMKHQFFVLIRTFIYFISYSVVCFFVIYFGSQGGLFSLVMKFSPHPYEYILCSGKLACIALTTGQYFVIMQLKSFIYNMYHGVVANLRWRAEGNE